MTINAALNRPHLGLAEGWSLLKTPSSEAGVQTYYRALLGRPAEADAMRAVLETLSRGGATRIDVLAAIAGSEERRTRGADGAGVLLIRGAGLLFRLSGARRVLLRRRAHHVAQTPVTAPAPAPQTAAEPTVETAALMRRIIMLEGSLTRLDAKLRASRLQEPQPASDDLSARLEALEAAVLELLNERADRLRRDAAAGDA